MVKPLKAVQDAKIAHFFYLRTQHKVHIALRAVRNQIAQDWTTDEEIGKNNTYTVRKIFNWRINIRQKFQ